MNDLFNFNLIYFFHLIHFQCIQAIGISREESSGEGLVGNTKPYDLVLPDQLKTTENVKKQKKNKKKKQNEIEIFRKSNTWAANFDKRLHCGFMHR